MSLFIIMIFRAFNRTEKYWLINSPPLAQRSRLFTHFVFARQSVAVLTMNLRSSKQL